jgi:hypothetical protein
MLSLIRVLFFVPNSLHLPQQVPKRQETNHNANPPHTPKPPTTPITNPTETRSPHNDASPTTSPAHDPPLPRPFKSRNPCSTQLRCQYHTADASHGDKSVKTSHALLIPRPHSINTVHSKGFVVLRRLRMALAWHWHKGAKNRLTRVKEWLRASWMPKHPRAKPSCWGRVRWGRGCRRASSLRCTAGGRVALFREGVAFLVGKGIPEVGCSPSEKYPNQSSFSQIPLGRQGCKTKVLTRQ